MRVNMAYIIFLTLLVLLGLFAGEVRAQKKVVQPRGQEVAVSYDIQDVPETNTTNTPIPARETGTGGAEEGAQNVVHHKLPEPPDRPPPPPPPPPPELAGTEELLKAETDVVTTTDPTITFPSGTCDVVAEALTILQTKTEALASDLRRLKAQIEQFGSTAFVSRCEAGSKGVLASLPDTVLSGSSSLHIVGMTFGAILSMYPPRHPENFWAPYQPGDSYIWIQVSLPELYSIKSVVTAGPGPYLQQTGYPQFFVSSYFLTAEIPNKTGHETYMTGEGTLGIFEATSPAPTTAHLDPPMLGLNIRLNIITCSPAGCRLNWELYGCPSN